MNKTVVALVALGALALPACGREVDADQTGSQDVPGAYGLKHFCHRSTLIYYSDWESSDDEYEWFYPGGCVWDEKTQKWVMADTIPQSTVGDSTEEK